MLCMRLAGNAGLEKSPKKSPSVHYRTSLSRYIFAIRALIDNRKKNSLSSSISSRCPHNTVNFGKLAAEIGPVVWGTPANFNRFRVMAASYCTASSSGRQPNFAALNRGHHLYSAGRPSRWALAHISSIVFCKFLLVTIYSRPICNRVDHYIFAL